MSPAKFFGGAFLCFRITSISTTGKTVDYVTLTPDYVTLDA